ncbi:App1 family protein [Sulfitobacter sp. S190]|uniref:App1 family protein n=1 Tax=Sulfitobacter sp. S190 TaxID=2867022 RepID=UPI0021A8B4ED|nr:phosphatase domain-containing protein [Sulfitobacter sp. S190]UWR22419.1 DUF2183 domain-containing protein [Sulfitobacter sp. S190]
MIKQALHKSAWWLESLLDSIKGQRDTRQVIEPYIGYATPEHLVVRGRVLSSLRRNEPLAEQSKWANFKQMVSLFATDEVADVEVAAQGVTTRSDDEGYFTLNLPRDDSVGWISVPVRLPGKNVETACSVLVPEKSARFGVISDIDDTMLRTGAYSLWKNLWTSMTGNATTRRLFKDAVGFMDALSDDGRNPVYYVSSSPWNLHHFIATIFGRAKLVRGPKFLRDLGLGENQFISGTHGDHKGGSIDTLMAANPDLDYVLVGDTGQHDAFVYRDAAKRHPGRVRAVVLREPGPGPDPESRAAIAELRDMGVPVLQGLNFDAFADQLFAGPLAQAA